MRILSAIVQIPDGFLVSVVPDYLHSDVTGWALVSHHDFRIPAPLLCFPEEFQIRRLVTLLRDIGFNYFAFMIDSAPKVMRLPSALRLRILFAKYELNLSAHRRTLSWQASIPRSCRRSSTLRKESGNRTYISTPHWIISVDVLKWRNGELVIWGGYSAEITHSTQAALTIPRRPTLPLRRFSAKNDQVNRPSLTERWFKPVAMKWNRTLACRRKGERRCGSLF